VGAGDTAASDSSAFVSVAAAGDHDAYPDAGHREAAGAIAGPRPSESARPITNSTLGPGMTIRTNDATAYPARFPAVIITQFQNTPRALFSS
jgi:hypothetical protein